MKGEFLKLYTITLNDLNDGSQIHKTHLRQPYATVMINESRQRLLTGRFNQTEYAATREEAVDILKLWAKEELKHYRMKIRRIKYNLEASKHYGGRQRSRTSDRITRPR